MIPDHLQRLAACMVAAGLCQLAGFAHSQSMSSAPLLVLIHAPAQPVTISLDEFHALPHRTLQLQNPHSGKTESYEGVPLLDLLARLGTPLGERLRGKAMATCVIAEAADDYRVVFSLAELDPSLGDTEVLVADRMDGAALDGKTGPLRLVVPKDKRPARWVRALKSLRVVNVPR